MLDKKGKSKPAEKATKVTTPSTTLSKKTIAKNTPQKAIKKSGTQPSTSSTPTKKKAAATKSNPKPTATKPNPKSKTTANPQVAPQDRLQKVKTILITQPKPENDRSPFFDLAQKYKLKIDWRAFIEVESITAKQFRRMHINLSEQTAVIFNSKNTIDQFFKIAAEIRYNPPPDLKYFCITESVALYLQKFIQYRKRKVFYADGTMADLGAHLLRFRDTDTFYFPCSNIRKNDIPDFLNKNKFKWNEAHIYRTVSADLSDLKDIFYDIIVFYSPADLTSVYDNFPDFQQNSTRIAAFGNLTAKAVLDKNLILDIQAPTPQTPSLSMAIENYLMKLQK